jgi:hypothetical protein
MTILDLDMLSLDTVGMRALLSIQKIKSSCEYNP